MNQAEEGASEDLGFANIYMVKLLYTNKPQISLKELHAKLEQYIGNVKMDIPDTQKNISDSIVQCYYMDHL